MPDDKKIFALDSTKRPPRSPRSRVGGYALLPRMLDKGRAEIAGTSGEYHFYRGSASWCQLGLILEKKSLL